MTGAPASGARGPISDRAARRRAPASSARSAARPLALILGGLVLVGAAILIVSSLGGSSANKNAASTSVSSTAPSTSSHHTTSHRKASAPAANPAETNVAVLNGAGTPGLAHRTASDLQQRGYSQATALASTPPSAQSTIVEYASGHRSEAQGVARALSVTQVQPLESATAALAPAAPVVVIVGADKAAAVGGGEEPSGGATAVP
jgi:hypothetical protein